MWLPPKLPNQQYNPHSPPPKKKFLTQAGGEGGVHAMPLGLWDCAQPRKMAPSPRCHVPKSISYKKGTNTWNISHHIQSHWPPQLCRNITQLPNNHDQSLGRSLTQCNHISIYSNCWSRRHQFFQTAIIHHPWVPNNQKVVRPCIKRLLESALPAHSLWWHNLPGPKNSYSPETAEASVRAPSLCYQGITSMKARANQCLLARNVKINKTLQV